MVVRAAGDDRTGGEPEGRGGRASRGAHGLCVVFLAVVLDALSLAASGQSQAAGGRSTDLLDRGRELYEDQQYELSIQTLSGALVRPDSTRDQRLETYCLLAKDHITLGNMEEAEAFVRALLALQASYELPERESPRFRNFFAAVRVQWARESRPAAEQSPAKPVTLRHRSPSEAPRESGMVLTAQVDDPEHRVARVKLFFRAGSTGKFSEETTLFDATAGSIRGIFPERAIRPPFVSYYLLAADENGMPVASCGDAEAPLRIPVAEEGKTGWVLPVAIGGGVVVIAGLVLGALALGGSHK